MFKPELLLPAGSIEAFFAALEGGADAIYLGLKDFNARKGAKNFTINQLPSLISLAHQQNTRLYITLNTVIKNDELAQLYTVLSQLEKCRVDAIIIQDWGVFHLIKKYFPKLPVHASTQMAFHNSIGANFAEKVGIERVILARELTQKELTHIKQNSKIELELFVHGALCYSFSGMCLFSSYLGGMSANRGACKQPCRRLFSDNQKKHYIFSLKDNELINFVPELSKLGISSLKIEGRMKSEDYVYTIARAYRMVIDDHSRISEATELLKHDAGRDKTNYFMGGKVNDAITELPNTGLYSGKITHINSTGFEFESEIEPKDIARIRIVSPDGYKQESVKIPNAKISGNKVSVEKNIKGIKVGYRVYTIGFSSKKFPSKLPETTIKQINPPSLNEAKNKTEQLAKPIKFNRPSLYLRIDSLAWLRKIRFEDIEFLILNLSYKEWQELSLKSPFLARNKHKIIAELPKFISEENLDNYSRLCKKLQNDGVSNFMVNHLSQIDFIPAKSKIYTSQYVYTFNDAAVAQLQKFGVTGHVYPEETDFENLYSGKDRSGIIPIHFTPQLFYSRMPVKINNQDGEFKDDTNIDYLVVKRSGITYTLPQKPVSILQNKQELSKKGFQRFLIDLSFSHPSSNTYKTTIKRYLRSEQIQPSTSFNYKKGLS